MTASKVLFTCAILLLLENIAHCTSTTETPSSPVISFKIEDNGNGTDANQVETTTEGMPIVPGGYERCFFKNNTVYNFGNRTAGKSSIFVIVKNSKITINFI